MQTLQHAQISRRGLCVHARGERGGGGLQRGEGEQARVAERLKPHVAQPEFQARQNLGALTAVLGFDGGLEFVLPALAQLRIEVVILFERGARGHFLLHLFLERVQPSQQHREQAVAAENGAALGHRRVAELPEPRDEGLVLKTLGPGGEVQAQAARENRFKQAARLGRKQNQHGARRRFLQSFQEGVRGLHVQPVRAHDDRDFVFRLGGLQENDLHQVAHLIDGNDAGLGFGPHPLHVRMIRAVNFPARQAGIARVGRTRHGLARARVLAVQRLRQRTCDEFEPVQIIAGKKIGVTKPLAGEAALEQFDGIFGSGEGGEGHGVKIQIPNPKFQTSSKLQISNGTPAATRAAAGSLELGICLGFGI